MAQRGIREYNGKKMLAKYWTDCISKDFKFPGKIVLVDPKTKLDDNSKRGKSRSINLAVRYKILVRDNFSCVICGRSPVNNQGVILHIDHILAWSKGGTNDPSNLRVLCSDCNLGKGDKHETT